MSLTKRDVVQNVLDHQRPPYVPWSIAFTLEAREKLVAHYHSDDLQGVLDNHLLHLGATTGMSEDLGNGQSLDFFGVVWDRSVDKDIGVVANCLLPEPDLSLYTFPDPHDPRLFAEIEPRITQYPECFRVFPIGFSVYERAWTLRGMENLMMDFYENPQFVHDLFAVIVDHNIARIDKALTYDIDGVYFGDDWGQQSGLQMGAELWRQFIKPQIARQYARVRDAGKRVFIHSCGDVDELFDDLVEIGVQCFNPFQPEVMDVLELKKQYAGRLAFHGGLSTQKTLPFGSVDEVRAETQTLLDAGQDGGYIFAPAHAMEGDVPVENMIAFIDMLHAQEGYRQGASV